MREEGICVNIRPDERSNGFDNLRQLTRHVHQMLTCGHHRFASMGGSRKHEPDIDFAVNIPTNREFTLVSVSLDFGSTQGILNHELRPLRQRSVSPSSGSFPGAR